MSKKLNKVVKEAPEVEEPQAAPEVEVEAVSSAEEPTPEVEVSTPVEAEEPKVEPKKTNGYLGGKRLISNQKVTVNGREFNKFTCEDGTTYILSDRDVLEQVVTK